ncbi:hypothetical protein M1M99_01700 [Thermodesulfovibrionales bacterium]|nr:hypothetical protein [Thermodesulfovibrionales bacterium]
MNTQKLKSHFVEPLKEKLKKLLKPLSGPQQNWAGQSVEKILGLVKNGIKKFYKTKQVRPIFAEEENEIVVVTVYVYYFN